METLGVIAFVIVIWYWSYPAKVKKLERKVKKLEREQKGEKVMSKLIQELIGKTCAIQIEEAVQFSGKPELECTVLDADDEWIKISYLDKKKQEKTRILRIDEIQQIVL